MIAKSRRKLYSADSLGREKYSSFKQQYEQIMPDPLQYHPSVCCFYTKYAASHLFNILEEDTGVQDVDIFSYKGNLYTMFLFFFTLQIPFFHFIAILLLSIKSYQ